MKAIVTLLFCFVFFISQSQSLNGSYYWIEQVKIQPASITGIPFNDPILSLRGQKFVVFDEVSSDNLLIRVLDYKARSKLKQRIFGETEIDTLNYQTFNLITTKTGDYQRYFMVSKDDFIKYAKSYSYVGGSLALGFLNLPFKARVQPHMEDFSGTFNFGVTLGYKFPHYDFNKWRHSLLIGTTFSNVLLDSVSISKNASSLGTANEFTALSISFGYVLEYEKIQVGIFYGWDHLNRKTNEKYNWDYQGKPWISLALGYSIFSNEDSSKSTGSN